MQPYYSDDEVTLYLGDCTEVLAGLPDASVDAIVTDPPYGLSELAAGTVLQAIAAWMGGDRTHVPGGKGFMGRDWDRFVPPPGVWDQCMRVLKPGGHLAAFAGSRTVDLMTLSIRIAGFEIRDSLEWIYGSGFPKGASQLKPAHEPIILARKPLVGTVAATVSKHGTGTLNIDGCRTNNPGPHGQRGRRTFAGFSEDRQVYGDGLNAQKTPENPAGRWPTNVVLSHPPLLDQHSEPVGDACADECVPGCPVAEMDRQSGIRTSGIGAVRTKVGSFLEHGGLGKAGDVQTTYGDTGGASRYFPAFRYEAKAPASERPRLADGTAHPTVKPLDLMRWLVRLVTPSGGTVLDPFTGSGTTLEAALLEGFPVIGIERDPTAAALSKVRLDKPAAPVLFGEIA